MKTSVTNEKKTHIKAREMAVSVLQLFFLPLSTPMLKQNKESTWDVQALWPQIVIWIREGINECTQKPVCPNRPEGFLENTEQMNRLLPTVWKAL